jgi:NADH-quinone oxidoreductase subunit M
MINSLLWAPLAFGLTGLLLHAKPVRLLSARAILRIPGQRAGHLLLPERLVGWWAVLGTLVTLGLAIALLAGFDSGAGGLQDTVDVSWIPGLGVDYSLGLDGLNLFLVLLTTVLWTGATAFAAFREQERPHLFFLMMLLGETATLGAFVAQDLLLFVLFFDLMLVPFYFLFGAWGSDREGGPTAAAATLKMIVYTLIGSLLMLVGAIATAIIASDGGHLTFSIAELAKHPVGEGSQRWIFWFFAAAFLVKMPAFLLHGWMPDAYRAAPLPVLAVFSGVLAKVGAYGFLRVVLPLFPAATVQFQTVVLLIALASILYGSVMAFTQTNLRLVGGYSSVAQLGFITAGIFALRADGADGAILQMVNHGLVVAPLFIIVALLAERSGTEDLREMGGMALRAPVLAALFLIVTLATLAMPGSANFIGEFYILNGLFQAKIVFAFVAISGVAMSAYYALRLYQRTMHNRPASQQNKAIATREIGLRDGLVLAPLVLCILGLALYPQLILKRTNESAKQAVAAACNPVFVVGSTTTSLGGGSTTTTGATDQCPGANDARTYELAASR